jgi:hypothetical protein
MARFGAHWLGPVGAVFITLGLGAAEAAHAVIRRHAPQNTSSAQTQPMPSAK